MPSIVSSEQGIYLTGKIIQALMKAIQTSWNYPCLYHSQSSGKGEITPLKLKVFKLVETTGFPWPKVLPLVLLFSVLPLENRKSLHMTVTGRPVSTGIQLSADASLSHASL